MPPLGLVGNLQPILANDEDTAPVATEGRLIDRLRRELRFRGLADAPYVAADMIRLAG